VTSVVEIELIKEIRIRVIQLLSNILRRERAKPNIEEMKNFGLIWIEI
jgi:hypothetical protein